MAEQTNRLRPAWRNYWPSWLLLVLLGAAAAVSPFSERLMVPAWIWLVAAVLVLGVIAFKRVSWRFELSEARVSQSYGIIARNEQSVRFRDLRSIELDQSLMQRLLGIGDVAFYSAGSDAAEVTFFGIPDPTKWRDRINREVDHA